MFDVAVIGGGVVGCGVLRELSRHRLRAVLLESEADVGFGVSKSNSGIVHAGHQSSPVQAKGQFDVRGNALFDGLAEELHFGFRRIGGLVVAQTAAELPGLEALKKQGEAKGVPGLELWKPDRLQREEPNLSPHLAGALFSPTTGVINPYEFCFALAESAVANGAEVRTEAPVLGIERRAEGFLLRTRGGTVEARFVVNCAGLFADQVAAMVGLRDFTIRPRRGEEYLLDKRLEGLVRRVIYPLPTATTKGTLIIPTYDGTLMVGPTAQDQDDRYAVDTTPEGAAQVFDFVHKLCPAISARDTIAEFAGLRPIASGDDFIIGPTAVPGFLNVAGIQSPGLTAAPAIAEHVCGLLRAQGLALEPKPDFAPRLPVPVRMAALDAAGQRAAMARNPAYGRVVCRCELVTEGEVLDAIRHGASTLDGLKFRTRAGMGRCQGGFCTARCMDLLAQQLGRPFAAITKHGGGSWLVGDLANAQHPAAGGRTP